MRFHLSYKINMIILSDSTKMAPFHITDDWAMRPLSNAKTPFKCLQTRYKFSFDQKKMVLFQLDKIILYFFMLRALNPSENFTATWYHYRCILPFHMPYFKLGFEFHNQRIPIICLDRPENVKCIQKMCQISHTLSQLRVASEARQPAIDIVSFTECSVHKVKSNHATVSSKPQLREHNFF
jgi:hypothetical protein